MKPLEDVRVVDLSRALAGPYCTMMLGDLGAEVIKVERPGRGDESRGWGPPFVGDPYGPYPGESAYFIAVNRNKRSVTVNLKSPEGQEIVRRLVASSDALVENFRTGALTRMGLAYPDLRSVNPGLVYCSISGYGRTGPYAERPGYDFVIQAEGGLMGITGPVEGPPYRVGVPIVDITAGMFAASAILAAIRARDRTGEGQLVDVSLFDASAALLTNVASNFLVGGQPPRRLGNAHPNIAPYEAFRAQDGWFALAAANQRQWATLCRAIDRPDLETDARFATNEDRLANRSALVEVLGAVFEERSVDEWLSRFLAAGLPCGSINTVADVFEHPQAEKRELVVESTHPTAGQTSTTGFPYKLSATPASIDRPPPLLGEHTEEVLTHVLSYSTAEVSELRRRGAI